MDSRKISSARIEFHLAGVFEQDGITLLTPTGIRRSSGTFALPADDVRNQDEATVKQVIAFGRISRSMPKAVEVSLNPHDRSAYVISLQHVRVRPVSSVADEHVSWHEAVQYQSRAMTDAPGVHAYAAASVDIAAEVLPWDVMHQFTAPTFEEAFIRVYGRWDRVHSLVREVGDALTSLLTRVERVEMRMADSIEGTFSVVDVPQFSFVRALAGFAALAFIVTLPANAVTLYRSASQEKDQLVAAGAAAVSSLHGMQPSNAGEALRNASSEFRSADAMLSQSNALAIGLAAALPSTYRSAQALLEAGDKSAEAGRLLADGFQKIFTHDDSRKLTDRLEVFHAYLNSASTLLREASSAAHSVSLRSMPENVTGKLPALQERLDQGTTALRELSGLTDLAALMLGKDENRRYLVMFQNPTELRPTGGFLGSFAEIVVDRGSLVSLSIPSGGTYALKGQTRSRLAPPKPLQLIAPLWQMQDANWSPDFPTSADRIRSFWSESGGPTIDGVIAVNATMLGQLLTITGPVEMPEYGKTITAENFLLEMQKAVEIEFDKTANTPKKFVGDLAAKMREKMNGWETNEWLQASAIFSSALETKDVQIALFHPNEETQIERFGWNSRLKPVEGDALALIETNVAGQKTDGVIQESVAHHVQIRDDGSVIDQAALTRSHGGIPGELFRGVRNVSYLRVYVPRGAELISASGLDTPPENLFKKIEDGVSLDPIIASTESRMVHGPNQSQLFEESGRTVFGGWMQLDPGKTQTITFTYRLPFHVQANASAEVLTDTKSKALRSYLLLSTSQSGRPRSLTTSIDYPESWKIIWERGTTSTSVGTIGNAAEWSQDRVTSVLWNTHDETP